MSGSAKHFAFPFLLKFTQKLQAMMKIFHLFDKKLQLAFHMGNKLVLLL